jgi:hypothetical protein
MLENKKPKVKKEKHIEEIEIKIDDAILKIPNKREVIVQLKNILLVLELGFDCDCEQDDFINVEKGKEEKEEKEVINFKPKPLPKPEDLPDEPIVKEINSIDDLPKFCPVCNSKKLKHGKIKKDGDIFIQSIKCKKWSCPYKREFRINI